MIRYTTVEGWLRTFDAHAGFGTIPHATRDSLARYMTHGCQPGGFVTAMLAQDIKAVRVADAENLAAIRAIQSWIERYVPSEAMGSYDRVRKFRGYAMEQGAP